MFLYFLLFDSRYRLFHFFHLLLLHLLVFNQVVVIIHIPLLAIERQWTVHVLVNLVLAEHRVPCGTKLEILTIFVIIKEKR
jgi:hypothetical protein